MRYYFHVRKGDKLFHDLEGSEFDSLEACRADAEEAARELLAEKILRREALDAEVFEITAEDGEVVSRLPFRAVLNLDR